MGIRPLLLSSSSSSFLSPLVCLFCVSCLLVPLWSFGFLVWLSIPGILRTGLSMLSRSHFGVKYCSNEMPAPTYKMSSSPPSPDDEQLKKMLQARLKKTDEQEEKNFTAATSFANWLQPKG